MTQSRIPIDRQIRDTLTILDVIRRDVVVGIPGQDEPAEFDKFRRDGGGEFEPEKWAHDCKTEEA